MSVAPFMDVHVRRLVTNGLRMRGVDVITAREDGTAMWSDDRLLDRAGELGRGLFSQDDELFAEAELRQRKGRNFTGVIYAHQLAITDSSQIPWADKLLDRHAPDAILNA